MSLICVTYGFIVAFYILRFLVILDCYERIQILFWTREQYLNAKTVLKRLVVLYTHTWLFLVTKYINVGFLLKLILVDVVQLVSETNKLTL